MPARFLIIDGYNLLYAAGLGRATYGPRDLERCRRRLLNFLAGHLTAAEQARATVIFDARHAPPDAPQFQRHGALRVFFATPHGDADLFIEDLLVSHSAPKQITLVSSDHRLQAVARRRRAKPIDSEVFFDELQRRRARGEAAASRSDREADRTRTGEMAAAELAYWLNLFGDSLDRELSDATPPDPASPTVSPRMPTGHQQPALPDGKRSVSSRQSPSTVPPSKPPRSSRRQRANRKPANKSDVDLDEWQRELERWLKDTDKQR